MATTGGGDHWRWRPLAVATTSALCVAVLLTSLGFTSAAQVAAQPVRPLPQSYQGALVKFTGNQVQLVLNGVTTTIANDISARLNPMFAQLATVSPDGLNVLYVTADSEDMSNTTFTTVNVVTHQKRIIANLGNAFWVHEPHWSPDGSQLLYVRQNASNAPELWIVRANGTHAQLAFAGRQLTHSSLEGRMAFSPQWSADGKSLIFYDSAYHPTTKWSVDATTGTLSSQAMPQVTPYVVVGGGGRSCNVPIYSQRDNRWGSNIMQTGLDSIANAGCALTSLTMLFDYFGANRGDPGAMNSCLGRYADPVGWYMAQVNPSSGGPGCDNYTTNWINDPNFAWSTLDSYLRSGWPVIVGGCYNDLPNCQHTHFVVVVSGTNNQDPSTYWINDPWDGQQKPMNALTGFTYVWMKLYQMASGPGSACA